MEVVACALKIIDKVRQKTDSVHVNSHQCKRLADHFDSVGVSIQLWREAYESLIAYDEEVSVPVEAFHNLVIVLERGCSLVLDYGGRLWVTRLLTRADNRETFEEIHKELVKCKTFLIMSRQDQKLDGNVRSVTTSEEQNMGVFKSDSYQDCGEMWKALDELKSAISCTSSASEHTQESVENVKKVLIEKLEAAENDEYKDFERLPNYLKIEPSEVVEEACIGRAFDGEVMKAKWLGCSVAVKPLMLQYHGMSRLCKEVGWLTGFRHPTIVQIIGASAPFHNKNTCKIIMELMDKSLQDLIRERTLTKSGKFAFTRREAIDIIIQIARGLQHLHRSGCVHGDLMPSNILVDDHGTYFDTKITDFGMSHQMGHGRINALDGNHRCTRFPCSICHDRAPGGKTRARFGSTSLAPHSTKGDIYGFAMTCYAILSGYEPFEEVPISKLISQVEAGVRPEFPSECGQDLLSMLKLCWDTDSSVRLNAEEICGELNQIRASEMFPAIGKMQAAIFRHRLHLSSPRVHRSMKWLTHMFGRRGREKSEARVKIFLSDGTESTMAMPHLSQIPRYLEMDPSTLRVVRCVHGDEGATVQVFELNSGGSRYAQKTFIIVEGKMQAAFTHELDILIKLHHPHIVQLMGYSVDDVRTSIIMEWIPTDLRGLIDSRPLSRGEAVVLIFQIALGMRYLHSCGVLHRDLKAKNVLVHVYPDRVRAKITDFGVSQFVEDATCIRSVGTGYWRAPEIFRAMRDRRSFKYTPMADVYSFAMVCYEILSGKTPFEGHPLSEYNFLIGDGGLPPRPSLPGDQNDALNKLIESCGDDVPERRPAFDEICARL